MKDEIPIKGLWWLPQKPERQLSGELSYGSTDGATLSLFDYFGDGHEFGPFTVWGTTVGGRDVSLFNCYATNVTRHLPGAQVAEMQSNFAVIGGHFKCPEEMRFVEVRADLSHLQEWAWTTGLTQQPDPAGRGWRINYATLDDISLGLREGFALALTFGAKLSPGFGNCRLTERCALQVSSKGLTEFRQFVEIIHRFQHFVALGVSRPVHSISLTARIDNPKETFQEHKIYEDFEIIRKLIDVEKESSTLIPQDMQFSLPDLKPMASTYIENYFNKHELLEPVLNLYFSTVYNRHMYIQQRFLALAHAIEAYHRMFIGGKYMSDGDYQSGLQTVLWNALPAELDMDFRASLKNKLKYLHEFSLRRRLQDICTKFSVVLKPFLGEPSQFASAIADQRNWLTHQDANDPGRPKVIDAKSTWLKCEQLSLLLEVCLLHEIGFDDKMISLLLPRNRRTRAIQINK